MTASAPRDPGADLGRELARLHQDVRAVVQVEFDRLRLAVRERAFRWIGYGLALLAAGVATVAAVVLLMRGLAVAVAQLAGGRVWAGDLVLGLLTVAALLGVRSLLLARMRRRVVGDAIDGPAEHEAAAQDATAHRPDARDVAGVAP